jgi:hypothetical protein
MFPLSLALGREFYLRRLLENRVDVVLSRQRSESIGRQGTGLADDVESGPSQRSGFYAVCTGEGLAKSLVGLRGASPKRDHDTLLGFCLSESVKKSSQARDRSTFLLKRDQIDRTYVAAVRVQDEQPIALGAKPTDEQVCFWYPHLDSDKGACCFSYLLGAQEY